MENLISQNPNILSGKPVITGTRMSVETILELFSAGMGTEEILKEYPFLKEEQVKAALEFAARMVGKEESYIFKKLAAVTHEISRRR